MKRVLIPISLYSCVLLSSIDAAIQIHPVADAMIIAGDNANFNFGDDTNLTVKDVEPLSYATRKSYLRFDLSAIDGSFDEATLSLFILNNSDNTTGAPTSFEVAVYGLKDNAVGQNWAEDAITWNNAPGNDATSGSAFAESESTFLGNLSVAASDDTRANVSIATTVLSDFLAADSDGLVTFMLARNDERYQANLTFWSKEEGTVTPYLTLVPEPSACAPVVGVLALGLAVIRRRVS